VPEDIPYLRGDLGGAVVDWESASIAYVAQRNGARCLILRGVTDLVGPCGGEAYDGTVTFFRSQAQRVMTRLLDAFPAWLDRVRWEAV
jgi:nucleoside phosphorylase